MSQGTERLRAWLTAAVAGEDMVGALIAERGDGAQTVAALVRAARRTLPPDDGFARCAFGGAAEQVISGAWDDFERLEQVARYLRSFLRELGDPRAPQRLMSQCGLADYHCLAGCAGTLFGVALRAVIRRIARLNAIDSENSSKGTVREPAGGTGCDPGSDRPRKLTYETAVGREVADA